MPSPDTVPRHPMYGINASWRELDEADVAAGRHRDAVGGASRFDEAGRLQLSFMVGQGLVPHHRLLDVGCGCLRAGRFFVHYLDAGCYHGLDINQSLLDAGELELAASGLADKPHRLARSDRFEASTFGTTFDWVTAHSLFTHLPFNHIARCMREIRDVLAPGGRFYATYFAAPTPVHLGTISRVPPIVTNYDANPYHQSVVELAALAGFAGLELSPLGPWGDLHGQEMVLMRRTDDPMR